MTTLMTCYGNRPALKEIGRVRSSNGWMKTREGYPSRLLCE